MPRKSSSGKKKTTRAVTRKRTAAGNKAGVTKRKTPAKKKSGKSAKKNLSRKVSKRSVARKKNSATSRRRGRTRRRSAKFQLPFWVRFLGVFFYRVSFACFLLFIVSLAGLYYFSRDLPSITSLKDQARQYQITILDKDGELVTHYGNVHGDPITVSELPPHVVHAFVATEDRNFYHHMGVNPLAIFRALIVNLRSGDIRQGGSTITQQFAKNAFLTPDRTVRRKIQEMLLAFRLEMAYTKDQILALYLNNVYFGSGTYGLRSASAKYFNKPPAMLTVGEAAMLAGLLKAPSRYSPSASPEAARERARVVIRAMHEAGYISLETMDVILAGPIARLNIRTNPAPYATDHVMAELREVFGEPVRDITIHTTLDLTAFRQTQEALEALSAIDQKLTSRIQVGLVSMETDGAIRLLVGGRSYTESQYNRTIYAKRQPGSAFKPFVYLAALEAGWQPNDIIQDRPVQIGNWQPANYLNRYYDTIEMGEAMARSLNAAVIGVQERIGRDAVIKTAQRLGFKGDLESGAALALGVNETTPMNLTASYIPFANGGYEEKPYIITSVYSKTGKLLYAREKKPAQKVINDDVYPAITHMLRLVVSIGSGRAAAVPGYVTAGKTGTTQDSRDAWFVGYAGGAVGGVWLGKDDYSPMTESGTAISGSNTPSVLWKSMMLATLQGRPDVPYVPWSPPEPDSGLFDWLNLMLRNTPNSAEGNSRQKSRTTGEQGLSSRDPIDELLVDILADGEEAAL